MVISEHHQPHLSIDGHKLNVPGVKKDLGISDSISFNLSEHCTLFVSKIAEQVFTDLLHAGLSLARSSQVAELICSCFSDFFEVAAPSQLHLPQHGMDAEDPGPLQDFRVRDPVLPSQLQYSAEAAEMKVIQLPGLVRVDGPHLRSVK
ncbi:unnamed protein product [Schistocephalus solidus]|uniref:BTP domain-containing protein n=1 Tax=Schistocephalus solidus TaxID=70667 RepID=A0A183TTT3_SCHSO|nr:unnamed protein product [Schistocephalus solidus]